MRAVGADIGLSVRQLLRHPRSSSAVVLFLALGLGVNTAVFAFFYGSVLRPLPYDQPDRLAVLFESAPGFTRASPSYADFISWSERTRTFAGLAAYSSTRRTLGRTEGAELLDGCVVTHNLFDILGVQPLIGRGLEREDDRPEAAGAVVLSHGAWQNLYGGDPAVLGATVTLDGEPHTAIGVMPAGFRFPEDADFWVPYRLGAARGRSGSSVVAVIGRLAEGATLHGARMEMRAVAAMLREEDPEANAERDIVVRPLEDDLRWGWRTPAVIFFVVASLVLALACANVAHLMLLRASSRRREIVIRSALGAAPFRIGRQLLTESVLLAVAGGALGLLVGSLGRDLFLASLPMGIPYFLRFDIDAPVLAALVAIMVVTGALAGLAPVLESTSVNVMESLRSGAELTPGGRHKHRFRALLIGVESALALVVLIGAGTAAKTRWSLSRIEPGFDPDKTLTARVAMPREARDDPERQLAFFGELRDRLAALPGVTHAALVSNLPVGGLAAGQGMHVDGTEPPPPGHEPWIINKVAQPDYFETMGIPLERGRLFDSRDGAVGTAPVVVVNEAFARHYAPDGDILGRRIKYGRPDSPTAWMEVVGVVGDVRHFGLDRPVELGIYEPFRQSPYWRMYVALRTATAPERLADGVRAEVSALDPQAVVFELRSMDAVMYEAHWRPITYARLFAIFAAVALMLAALGVYGVIASSTRYRTREFGLRMALGGGKGSILWTAVRGAALPTGAGLAIGLAVSVMAARLAVATAYGADRLDLAICLASVGVVTGVAVTASWAAARRAVRVDPAVALRGE